jgi:hypothetical protein
MKRIVETEDETHVQQEDPDVPGNEHHHDDVHRSAGARG